MKKYDYLIVGAGLSGSVIARKLAENGKKCLIVERRNHLGGNIYDYKNEDGILIQKYGPHSFHSNIDEVIEFVTKYCGFNEYHIKCQVSMEGKVTPSPFNFKTIDQFYNKDYAEMLKNKLLSAYPNGKATVVELLENKDTDIKKYAQFLFDKDYSQYTSKQWGIEASEVDPSVLKRVPVLFSYNDCYFDDKFEGLPKGGFMSLINALLNHPNIDVLTNVDAFEHITFNNDKCLYDNKIYNIIFTGPVDELFNYKYGKLPYRSLKFELETLNTSSFQTSPIVAYPSHEYKFTRITEYTKLPYQDNSKTVIAREYPLQYVKGEQMEPYYPILTKDSKEQYDKYESLAKQYSNLTLLGRLAEFKYYNMDQVIDKALKTFDKIINN